MVKRWVPNNKYVRMNDELVKITFDFILKKDILEKFRDGKVNVLIGTSIIEEGVDIPACNMVLRFNLPKNFGSYIQSKVL